jgi:hypothetical protein
MTNRQTDRHERNEMKKRRIFYASKLAAQVRKVYLKASYLIFTSYRDLEERLN